MVGRLPERQADSGGWGLVTFGVCILPSLAAIWLVPWFVAGDGPAHLYNAYIMSELIKGNALLQDVYALQWQPVPNLLGHWLLVGLLQVLPARTADRILMTCTSVGLASAVLWLRWRVRGQKGIALIVPLTVLIALNWMWVRGFYNFLLGACFFPITLGYWWVHRDAMGRKQAVILAVLLVLGYLCHLLSSLLTVFGLVILSVATPGPKLLARCRWTAIGMLPLLPLGFIYYQLGPGISAVQPKWRALPRPYWSLHEWLRYLERDNPFAILPTNPLPIIKCASPWFDLLHPPLWLIIGLVAFILGKSLAYQNRNESSLRLYRGWIVTAFCCISAWAVAPDSLGQEHGGIIPIRFLPLALIPIVPVLMVDAKRIWGWIGSAAMAVAVTMQSAVIWDVALVSNHFASAFVEAIPSVGTGNRIGMLAIDMPSQLQPGEKIFPFIHLDNLLGVGKGNVIWHNYEAVQYYFPVQMRHAIDRDITQTFVDFERMGSDAANIKDLLDRWARLLANHHARIDVLVVWGVDPRVDQINRQWYGPEPVFQRGELRVFYHR